MTHERGQHGCHWVWPYGTCGLVTAFHGWSGSVLLHPLYIGLPGRIVRGACSIEMTLSLSLSTLYVIYQSDLERFSLDYLAAFILITVHLSIFSAVFVLYLSPGFS